MKDFFKALPIVLAWISINCLPLAADVQRAGVMRNISASTVGTSPGTANLLAYFAMDTGSGTSFVDSDGGTYTGSHNLSYSTGKVGTNALTFTSTAADAAASGISVTYSSSVVSFSFWIKRGSTAGTEMILESSVNAGSFNQTFACYLIDSSSRVQFYVRDDAGNVREDYSTTYPASGTWEHWVWVADVGNATHTVYRNNSLLSLTAQTTTSSGSGTFANNVLYVGSRGKSSLPYIGDLDDIAVFNDALTADEVTYLYQNGNGVGYGDL